MSEATERRRARKDEVMELALSHAAFDGWGKRTLDNAAADAGLDRNTTARLFPGGPESLLAWLEEWTDRQMLTSLEGVDLLSLPVRERIARLVRARIEVLAPHKEAMRRAALARGLRGDVGRNSQALWHAADVIWQHAGFGAGEGVSHYTRRALLVGILLSTYLYWFEDNSEEHQDTWSFLNRRIGDALRIGKMTGRISGLIPSPLRKHAA